MIKKQFLKSRPVCKLIFELSSETEADRIDFVSSVDEWQGAPMKRLKDGRWQLKTEVPAGSEVGFRYRLVQGDAVHWLNDEDADRLVTNTFGSQDGVIDC